MHRFGNPREKMYTTHLLETQTVRTMMLERQGPVDAKYQQVRAILALSWFYEMTTIKKSMCIDIKPLLSAAVLGDLRRHQRCPPRRHYVDHLRPDARRSSARLLARLLCMPASPEFAYFVPHDAVRQSC